jgi:dihydropyrimidinase
MLQEFLEGSDGRLSVETTPHYLTLTENNEQSVFGKVGPPLRASADNDALWAGIADHQIHTLGSDHVPSMLPVRQAAGAGVWETKLGFAGIGVMLPMALEVGVHQRRLPLQVVLGALTWEPARRFGLYPRKRSLSVGADADIIVLDLEKSRAIKAGCPAMPEDHTPYEGLTARGWPVVTLSHGEVIAENDACTAVAGRGAYLRRN